MYLNFCYFLPDILIFDFDTLKKHKKCFYFSLDHLIFSLKLCIYFILIMAHDLQQEYMDIPIITRVYTTACVLTTTAVVRNNLKHIKWKINTYFYIFKFNFSVSIVKNAEFNLCLFTNKSVHFFFIHFIIQIWNKLNYWTKTSKFSRLINCWNKG